MDYKQDYWWLNKDSTTFLSRGYLREGVKPQERFRQIAETSEKILKIKGFADKFESYLKKGWYSLASPIISNFGAGRGLPISCNGSYCPDTIEGILSKVAEVGVMSKYGAGTSSYFGDVRARGSDISTGGKTSGSVHFMELFDTTTNVINQSNVRRGQFAAYLPVEHRDILEFLEIRSEGNPIQHMSIGVTITDKWMQDMIDGNKEYRKIWAKIIQKRFESGYPYVFFTDTVNNNAPQVYKDKGLKIHASNLCTEIAIHASKIESFVCDLSSVNVLFYDDWKSTDAVEILTYFLDSVMTEYIDKTENIKFMECANRFAKNQRALGLGVLGWHSYLQSKMISFESLEAKALNIEIFKLIDQKSLMASKEMAKIYGEPELLKGYGLRNVTRCVTGDTLILTESGQIPIKELVDKNINIWNGFEFSNVKPYKTGVSEIYKVSLSNGKSIKCTADHIFKIVLPIANHKDFNNKRVIDVPCKDLRIEDCLAKFLLPIINTNNELQHSYTNGFFTGDGSISCSREQKYPRKEIRLYGNKMLCADRISWKSSRKTKYGDRELIRGYIYDSIENKFFVPINFSVKSKIEWLAGIVDSDGSSTAKGIMISTMHYDFALNISYLLQTLGCHSYISKITRKGGYYSNNSEYYSCNISMQSCTILSKLGFSPSRVSVPINKKDENDCPNHQWVQIISIEKLKEQEETFCFTEEKNHTGVFNGIMTGQCAVAPTTSSSFILGQVSPSIEPLNSNYFVKDLDKGKFTYKNPYLAEILKVHNKNDKETWNSILTRGGSVQHLKFLSDKEKDVFKTFGEISQMEIIIQAASRQKYIDQAQSINLMIHPKTTMKEVSNLMIDAWKMGIKTLYYQRSTNPAMELNRSLMTCASCES